MLDKTTVLNMINQMHDEFELEDAIESLIIFDKIKKAEKQIEKGEFYSHDEVIKEIKTWFKK